MNPMKDSGVEWIGEIPRDWEIKRLKSCLTIFNGRDYKEIEVEEGGYPVLGSGGEFTKASNYLCDEPSVLMGRKGTVDKPIFMDCAFWVVDTMFYSTMKEQNVAKYMYYYATCFKYDYYVTSTALPSMTQYDLGSIKVAIPEAKEQQAIADFLDEETKKLDDAKDLLQKQIEKLKEYRKSLIWETVTKGLDKSVPMKDSGVEWIGEIPKQWDIAPLITVAKENKIKNARMKCNNLLSLSYGNIIRKNIYTNFGLLPESFEGYQIVHEGYLILRMTDLQNDKHSLRTGYVTETGIITSAYIGLIPCKTINNKYLSYLLHSYDLIKIYYNLGTGVRQSLTFNEIKKLPVLLPLKEEQQAIADFLDEKTTIIEKIISNIQSQIKVIDKQKKTLIYDYVTGKRRVI